MRCHKELLVRCLNSASSGRFVPLSLMPKVKVRSNVGRLPGVCPALEQDNSIVATLRNEHDWRASRPHICPWRRVQCA